ncbi:MAG: lipoyl(octanoyl) transferase LipB [Thaumarchaeota archaeon]|nr:lipoyl(octanoyl) transferase LipB [Nitrososphaerota archaeon]
MTPTVLDLGRADYGPTLELQRSMAAKRARGEIPDTLLLVEHNSVITLGRKTTPENFKPQDIEVFQVERGGDATYHGPGQLVGYPIILLADHDVRRHVWRIEEALVRTTARFGLKSERKEGHRGVWSGEKKLASVGVAVVDWVAFHGFALNVNTDLSYFELIRPCGLDPDQMTSMEKRLGGKVDLGRVKSAFVNEYDEVLSVTGPVSPLTSVSPGNIK